jgi:hypothetical protein
MMMMMMMMMMMLAHKTHQSLEMSVRVAKLSLDFTHYILLFLTMLELSKKLLLLEALVVSVPSTCVTFHVFESSSGVHIFSIIL